MALSCACARKGRGLIHKNHIAPHPLHCYKEIGSAVQYVYFIIHLYAAFISGRIQTQLTYVGFYQLYFFYVGVHNGNTIFVTNFFFCVVS